MSRNERGFTLIELMIVIAIIAIIAAIAIPNLLAARLAANETAAIATLRNITSAQAQFQQTGKADTDGDGTGSYGGFLEMSGGNAGRLTTVLIPPVLSSAFQVMTNGAVTRSGYLFQMWLPDNAGAGVAEDDVNSYAGSAVVDAGAGEENYAETTWCCYAWPVNYNQSGNRTFFTNQSGDILAIELPATPYDLGNPPTFDAAFQVAGDMTSLPDLGGVGQSPGPEVWRQVN